MPVPPQLEAEALGYLVFRVEGLGFRVLRSRSRLVSGLQAGLGFGVFSCFFFFLFWGGGGWWGQGALLYEVELCRVRGVSSQHSDQTTLSDCPLAAC